MPRQSLIWTVLPNGFSSNGRSLRFSVLMSPRLDAESAPATLQSFPDFLRWPDTLAQTKFSVTIGTTTIALTADNRDTSVAAPDSATWAALFPASTFVRAFAMRDYSKDTVVSFDTVAMHALVRDTYARLTAFATSELPSMNDLLAEKGLRDVVGMVNSIDRAFWDKNKKRRDVAGMLAKYKQDRFKGYDTAEAPLAAFELFNTPPSELISQTAKPDYDPRLEATWSTHKRATLDAAQAVRDLDFHQIVAAMNQYPTLLRRLGLVVDFIVPPSGIPLGADVAISVRATLPSTVATNDVTRRVTRAAASPVTRTRLTANTFAPVPRPSPDVADLRVADGRLSLDPKRFALLQADVDGAGQKLLNFARTLAAHVSPQRQLDNVTDLPRRVGAPALRNAGMMLVHSKRGDALSNAFERNKARDAAMRQAFVMPGAPPPALYAEDLVRGWRVDVWDKRTGVWRSLCERVANYDVGKGASVLSNVREEGTVRLATTSSATDSNSGVLYLHETLLTWHGWSLAARPPGLAITPGETVGESSATVPDGINLRTSFVATPGSLPRLRYGRSYAMRVRVVDLAGNSLAPSTANYPGDESATAAAQPYLRFEPVQPPGFTLLSVSGKPEVPKQGESMARIAIRTFNNTFDDTAVCTDVVRRGAVAPRVSQRDAELHGAMDGPRWGTPGQFTLLATRDVELAQVDVTVPGGNANDATTSAKYTVLGDSATTLPYLPDPLCTHVIARLTIGSKSVLRNPVIEIPLYPKGQTWPDAVPFRIQLYESPRDEPRFDEPTRTLLIPLAKAGRARLRLMTAMSDETLALMGVWNWIPEVHRTADLTRTAKLGGLWPLTPWRELDLVHAVQRPLLAPTVTVLAVERPSGATFVKLGVDAKVHRASSDRVDVRATWNEPRDAKTGAAPKNIGKADIAFSVKITDPQGFGGVPEHLVPDPNDQNRIAFGPLKLPIEVQGVPYIEKVHDFGDTRYRRVEYQLVATSRFREYMPSEVLTDGATPKPRATDANIITAGPVARTWAPSSAPPPAPEVLYVVPTFGWTRSTGVSGSRVSTRRGAGLRVWLDRPWNASGYGEMLAVALLPTSVTVDPDAAPYKHTVTQWANDPTWKTPFVNGVGPTRANFPRARTAPDPTGAWLPPGAPLSEADQPSGEFPTQYLHHAGLAENVSEGRVDVAPHDVFWDADRQLWYCDIEIDHGTTYFPFVRLALARYQPVALPNARVSNIVMADFAALTPHRTLSVSRVNNTRRGVRVAGIAPLESSGHTEAWARRGTYVDSTTNQFTTFVPTGIAKGNVIEVWVEKHNAAFGEDFGWQRVAEGVEGTPEDESGAPQVASTPEWPTLWRGSVELPSTSPAGTRFRVVVAEYEEYLVDGADPYANPIERKARRMVFVEHVEMA